MKKEEKKAFGLLSQPQAPRWLESDDHRCRHDQRDDAAEQACDASAERHLRQDLAELREHDDHSCRGEMKVIASLPVTFKKPMMMPSKTSTRIIHGAHALSGFMNKPTTSARSTPMMNAQLPTLFVPFHDITYSDWLVYCLFQNPLMFIKF